MLTRKELCQLVVSNFASEPDGEDIILKSSILAVAMDYLGLLTDPDMQAYAASRDGVVYLSADGKSLTFRELLTLLPEVPDETPKN